jgi:mannose-6-phosphate isomerase-like protein (cupin superfamily)
MPNYILPEPGDWSFDRVGVQGKLFPTSELIDRFECLLIVTHNGHETTIIERECDFVYYVLAGHGSFVIDDVDRETHEGDLVVVPHGHAFTYSGSLRMLLIASPPWSLEQESVVGD